MTHASLVIRNANIIDGTGAAAYLGDVVVNGDTISEVISRVNHPSGFQGAADRDIDGTGFTVTPGFVDVHSHSDINILANPMGESKLRQGVTTEIVGNCGFSAFPTRGTRTADDEAECERLGIKLTWSRAEQYFTALENAKPAMNFISFVGHGNVRSCAMGQEDRVPSADELATMEQDVEEALEAGAIGLSTGLIYAPGIFAQTPEIAALQAIAHRRGGIYTSHVRGEGDTLLEAADEFMDVIARTGSQGQFSHLKASGPRNWGKVAKVIELIEAANDRGARIRFDKYPYVASSTSLSSLLPRWVRDGGTVPALERLNDAALRVKIMDESSQRNEGKDGWASVLICEAGVPELEKYQGQSVAQAAEDLGMAPAEMFVELLVRSRLGTSISNFTMSQDETDAAILHPLGMVCSDAACRAPYGHLHFDCPHPRAYGTFGKFFRDYVRERTLLTPEQAVAKVTSLPCETFGIKRRGVIREGYFADLLLLDLNTFEDRATFAAPHQYCEGLEAIIVNGTLTVLHGEGTGQRNGRVLRLGRDLAPAAA